MLHWQRCLVGVATLLLAASTTAAPVVSMDPTATHTFTRVPGSLPAGADVAPPQNLTTQDSRAWDLCSVLDACIGITFKSPTAYPNGVVQIYFKGKNQDCGYSRFGDGICPSGSGKVWQTYLKDFKPMARKPQWLRHYNLSVVPPRCGDINIEPLMPFDMSDNFIADYAANAVEDFSSYVLELGECGKVGPDGNPWAVAYTKRGNPPSLGTPWLSPGTGPGDPGYPASAGYGLQALCETECGCTTSGHQDPWSKGRPRCSDTNCVGRCVVCSPSFNQKLASNSTLVRLWCDPADPACKNGDPTRPPKNVRVLADFARDSPTNVKWTVHASTTLASSNFTIVNPSEGDSYAEFNGAVRQSPGSPITGIARIATIAPAFTKMDLAAYAESGSIVVEARYPRAHHCYNHPSGGGSECHYEGFKLSLTSSKVPRHHGGHELFGMYKADFSKAKRTTQGPGWTILRLPLTAFSSDWSDLTGECNTMDPDGYQHKCCAASSGMLPKEPCPTRKGLGSIIGLSVWSEGVPGDFSLEIKSISIET